LLFNTDTWLQLDQMPTIVAAMKAYDAGGWEGVAVKRRGRPTATDALSSDRLDELRQNLHSHLLSVTEAPVDADALWSTMRVQNWLASQGVDVSPATVARHARAWDLAPSSPAIAEKAAVGTPRHQFIAAARAAKKRVVWLSAHPTSIRIDDPKNTKKRSKKSYTKIYTVPTQPYCVPTPQEAWDCGF